VDQQLISSSLLETSERDPRIVRALKQAANEDLLARGVPSFDRALALGLSERTLRRLAAAGPNDGDPFTRFFESPEGLAFIRNLLVALYVVVVMQAKSGPGAIAEILELCRLSRFVANSVSTHQRNVERLASNVRAYGFEEIPRLAALKPISQAALVGDELFRGEQPILVALDAVSNFLFFESIELDRTSETWQAKVVPVLEKLNVEATSFTGDGAKALLKLAETLGIPYAPDNAHVAGDIAKGLANSLEKRARKAESLAQEESLTRSDESERLAVSVPAVSPCEPCHRLPLEPDLRPETTGESGSSPAVKTAKRLEADKAREQSKRCKAAMKDLRNDYHPIDLETGAWRSSETLSKELKQIFDSLRGLLSETKASQGAHHRIAKAERAAAGFVLYLQSHLDLLDRVQGGCTSEEDERMAFAAAYKARYLELAAERERDYEFRNHLRLKADLLREEAQAQLSKFEPKRRSELAERAETCAALFRRSSSAVEGRNGQLSKICHRSCGLRQDQLEVLTILHNFWSKRADGTTAAERFFKNKPRDLFAFLVERFDLPSKPYKIRI
jgi:hypothetical protein